MELQGLQEALKVEIQCHQDGELTRQLHDRQSRITALSDKQKLVKTCPLGATKPLSLIKPPAQGIAISVVPTKVPVSMVTAHLNGQKVATSEPINLQTGSRAVGAGVLPFTRRAPELPPSQVPGPLSALGPQGGSLQRLTGQAAALLPQVRPKTHIPDSLPQAPCQERQASSLQRAVVSPKSQGATLPTANSTLSPHHQPHAQSPAPPPPSGGAESAEHAQQASAGPGVAYAIIASSPAPANGDSAVSEAVKVIIIQPQAPGSAEGSPSIQEAPLPTSPPLRKDQDPEKIAFMVALGLVTTEHLEEIQAKRQERKRRSTANPAYSGLLEPERKRLPSHYLDTSLLLTAPDSEDVCWKEELEREDRCAVCQEDGELQPCHNCPRAFHPGCLHPPLKTPPRGPWYCPRCQKKVLNKENMSWSHNFIQSYNTHKTVRQQQKLRLLRRGSELQQEQVFLQDQDRKLSDSVKRSLEERQQLLGQQREAQASLERLRALVRLIQRHASRAP